MAPEDLLKKIKTLVRASLNYILAVCSAGFIQAAINFYRSDNSVGRIVFWVCAAVAVVALVWLVIRLSRTIFGETPSEDVISAIGARGLIPYNDRDASLFWQLGRQDDVRRLIAQIHNTTRSIIVLHGADGVGKTSVVWAGLKPALEKQGIRCVYCDAAATDPVMATSKAIRSEPNLDVGRNLAGLVEEKTRTVLIIDSFEKLDVAVPEHVPFLTLVQALNKQSSPHAVQLVVALRDSYLPRWSAIEQLTGVRATRVQLKPLSVDVAIRNIERLCEEADVKINRAIIRDYIRSSSIDVVCPVDIAVGAQVFAEWAAERPGHILRSADYASAGGAVGVWCRHLQQYLRSYVSDPDQKGLIAGLAAEFVDRSAENRSLAGASASNVAASGQLDPKASERYLSDLASREMRVLGLASSEVPPKYRLARESFVVVVKQLQQELIAPGDHALVFLMSRLRTWKNSNARSDLLSGALLRLAVLRAKAERLNPELNNYIQKSRVVQRRRRAAVGVSLAIAVAFATFAWHWLGGYLQETKLANWLLPPELYERQGRMKALTIRGYAVTDLGWLKHDDLRKFEVRDARLTSVAGMGNLRSVQDVTLDLSNTGISKMQAITDVPGLTTLTLFLGHSHVTNLTELEHANKLTGLTVYLGGSSIRSIADISRIRQLRSLRINLAGSSVQDLSPLSGINTLEVLTLEIESSQLGMIADITPSRSIQDLTLIIQNPRNLHGHPAPPSIPNLSSMESLAKLTIILKPGSAWDSSPANVYPPVFGLGSLRLPEGLRELAIDSGGFSVSNLPQISNLKHLTKLALHVNGAALSVLPLPKDSCALQDLDLSVDAALVPSLNLKMFRDLKALALATSGTTLKTLPSMMGLDGLRNLTLDVAQTDIMDFRQLSRLRSLRGLEIHLNGAQVEHLPSLAALQQIRSISLHLSGEVQALPALGLDHDLTALTIGLNRSSLDHLPDLGQFRNIQAFSLLLAGSKIHTLDALSLAGGVKSMFLDVSDTQQLQSISFGQFHNLTELTIAVHGSAIQSILDTGTLRNLKAITLDARDSAFVDFLRFQGFDSAQEVTLDQSCSSLRNLPDHVERVSFLWTTR